jgi:hypothetical protein
VDHYLIWCDLRPGVRDLDFVTALDAWLGRLREEGRLAGWSLTRRKLGFGPPGMGEFAVDIHCDGLAQLDLAFAAAATRAEPYEPDHAAVYAKVQHVTFALYRDFPDPMRAV